MLSVYIGIVILIIIDQLVKWWTVTTFPLHTGQTVIENVFSLFYIQNNGAAWGMLSGNMIVFFVITILFLGGIGYWFHKNTHSKLETIAYSLIVAGAIGNFIDRVRLGYVIDMFRLDFIDFPIFNVADICLTVGVCLVLLDTLFVEGRKK